MDPFRQAIHTFLTAQAPVTGLLGDGSDGIYHRRAPVSAADPLVVFERRTGIDRYLFGTGELLEETWAVRAIVKEAEGKGVALAEQIAAAIDDALHDAQLLVVDHRVLWLRRLSMIDYEEPDGQTRFHHCGGVYRLASEPA